MASVDVDAQSKNVPEVRAALRRSAHVQQARQMLVAACLAAVCVVVVAGTLLAQLL